MSHVLIKSGTFTAGSRVVDVQGQVFELVKPFHYHRAVGNCVTVKGTKEQGLANRSCRIVVNTENDIEYITGDGDSLQVPHKYLSPEEQFRANETDEAAMERIARSFDILNEITDAAAQGIIKGVVVSGPPGIGKSYGVNKTLEQANFTRTLSDKQEKFEIICGSMTPIGLYKKLYLNRQKGFVTVLDDCDTALFDEQALNLLKAALDTTEKRRLSWLAESHALRKEEIPDTFDFEGSIIFLTNLDFEDVKSNKIAAHLQAILSRCHYMNLEISSQKDQLLRIKQVVRFGMLDSYNLSPKDKADVVDFVFDNADDMKELSLRAVIKLADLAQADRSGSLNRGWEELAEMTMLTKEAYYKRRLK